MGPAWADDASDMLAANERFIPAFNSLDITKLEPLWTKDTGVTVMHPSSKETIVGWPAVRAGFAQDSFTYFRELNLAMLQPHVAVARSMARVVGIERLTGKRPDGTAVDLNVMTTTIYEKRDGAWLMVHHHGSALPR